MNFAFLRCISSLAGAHPRAFASLRPCVKSELAALVLLLATFTHAQTSQFLFDANGNLLVQSANINAPPQIIGQPQNRTVGAGETASFFAVAADTRALTYQWRFNGANIGGATNDAFLLSNVTTSNEGEYRVVLTNPSGSVTSAPAFLMIDSDGDNMGDSWEFTYFGGLDQNATRDLDGDGSSNLEEFRNGTDPTNSNSYAFRLVVISDAGSVIKTPDRTMYTNGQTVTLTAIPPPNGSFHAWLGDIVTRSNPVTLVMTRDKTVYARFTPIIFNWTSLASGDWDEAANWAPNLVPGSNDTAVIVNNVTVTLNTSADCADVTFGHVATTPTLTGSGSLTVRGKFAWTSGIMSGSGRTIIETGGMLEIDASSPATPSLFERTLENGGTTLWTGDANFGLNSNAVLTNRAGALFEIQSGAAFGAILGSSRIDNTGTFRKSSSGGTTTIGSGVSFNNYGAVEIQTGTLNFAGGGIHSASSSMTGPGHLTFSGGTANLAGLVNVSGNYTFSGGTASFSGNTICTNNTITISGGTANFSGSGTVSPSVVNLSNGTLDGANTVTVNNAMNWTGGSMGGSGRTVIPAGVTLNLSNVSGSLLNTRILENGGTVLWTGTGGLAMNSGAVITNHPGALIHIQNALTIPANVGSGRIDNAGTFRKSVSAGTTTFGNNISFNNSGVVDIQTGALALAGGGTHSGEFNVPAATEIIFAGGTHTANPSSSITGTGRLTVTGGIANLAGLVNVSGNYTLSGNSTANFTGNTICTNNTITISGGIANFSGTGLVSPAFVNLSLGALGGTGIVMVNNAMNWTGGDMSSTGGGRTIILPGATLNIPNSNAVFLNTRTLENVGRVLWSGNSAFVLNGGAVITNRTGALFDVHSTASFIVNVGVGRIDNIGTFRKSGNSGATSISLSGGITFNNYGTVDIRSGILAANGGYTSTANALLNCALGGTTPGGNFGQLQVSGTVTPNGALSVELINGFVPATNDSFAVLTAGTRSGTFNNFLFPSNAVSMQLSNTANSVVVRVTNVFIVPQAAPVPAGLISWWRAEGNALDSIGTNHGVLTNGATFATGQVGQTFALDGANDYVQVPDSSSLRPVSVTIEAWVNFFATNGIRIVLGKPLGNNTTFDSYGLALQDGAVLAAICDNGGFGPFLTGPANTVTGKWYHLAYTFDDSSKQQVLYVDGAPVASGTANKTISYDTHPVLLGVDIENGVLSFFHNGQIDEASLYNRALTRDEIATIFNAGAAGKQLFTTIAQPMLLPPEIFGTNFKLTWSAVPNASYRVEFNANLSPSNWNVLPGDIIGVSNTASKLDALTPTNRFYRVRVLP